MVSFVIYISLSLLSWNSLRIGERMDEEIDGQTTQTRMWGREGNGKDSQLEHKKKKENVWDTWSHSMA